MGLCVFNVQKIKDYIIEFYPDSCLSINYANGVITDAMLPHECIDFFYYEKLNWCGCGDPISAIKVVRDFLDIFSTWEGREKKLQERFEAKTIYDNDLLLCLAYTLDRAGLIEHGTSIGSPWITREGEMLLWLLNNYNWDDEECQEENDGTK